MRNQRTRSFFSKNTIDLPALHDLRASLPIEAFQLGGGEPAYAIPAGAVFLPIARLIEDDGAEARALIETAKAAGAAVRVWQRTTFALVGANVFGCIEGFIVAIETANPCAFEGFTADRA